MTEPKWTWCPMPGVSHAYRPRVEQAEYGDGYVQRATRGLNPMQHVWSLAFPFDSAITYGEMAAFLEAHAVHGFYFDVPDLKGPGVEPPTTEVFVYCDEWSCSVSDRSGAGDLRGSVNATFTRCYNPQPIDETTSLGVVRRTPPPALAPQLTMAVHPVPQELVAVTLMPGVDPVGVPREVVGPNMVPTPTQPTPNMPFTPTGAVR